MGYRIVTDSAANLANQETEYMRSVPLHITVGDHDYIDDDKLDLTEFHQALCAHKGKTITACPSPEDWIKAFGDEEVVFCVTITSGLSGSYNSAEIAGKIYKEKYPDRKVYSIDSLSTGPEMVLLIRYIQKLMDSGMDSEEVYQKVEEYSKRTHLMFVLGSVDNLAKNGRVHPLIAKGLGLLGIRLIGKASDAGKLEMVDRERGEKKAYQGLVKHMKKVGYQGGQVVISHTNNPSGAQEMQRLLTDTFGSFSCTIHENRGLCGFYAEPSSILVGFEA